MDFAASYVEYMEPEDSGVRVEDIGRKGDLQRAGLNALQGPFYDGYFEENVRLENEINKEPLKEQTRRSKLDEFIRASIQNPSPKKIDFPREKNHPRDISRVTHRTRPKDSNRVSFESKPTFRSDIENILQKTKPHSSQRKKSTPRKSPRKKSSAKQSQREIAEKKSAYDAYLSHLCLLSNNNTKQSSESLEQTKEISPRKKPKQKKIQKSQKMDYAQNLPNIEEEWLEGAVRCYQRKHFKTQGSQVIQKTLKIFEMEDGSKEVVEWSIMEKMNKAQKGKLRKKQRK